MFIIGSARIFLSVVIVEFNSPSELSESFGFPHKLIHFDMKNYIALLSGTESF